MQGMKKGNNPHDMPTNGSGNTHRSRADANRRTASDQPLIVTVVELLANELDEDPLRMHPPIGDVIDPDVLEYLERSDHQSEQTFTFTYRNLAVSVTNRGTVHVSQMPVHGSRY